jgi:hypothetical protein
MGHGLAQQVYGRLPKNLGINMEMIIAHFLVVLHPLFRCPLANGYFEV